VLLEGNFRALIQLFNSLNNPGEVEACLKASGSSFEWMDNGVLRTVTKALPAVRLDEGPRRSNSKNFFNSLVAAYTGSREG
jgi:hypothetical protein